MHAGIVDLASGRVRQIARERGQTWVRSWSPDGRKAAPASVRDGVWRLRWIGVATGAQGTITPPDGRASPSATRSGRLAATS